MGQSNIGKPKAQNEKPQPPPDSDPKWKAVFHTKIDGSKVDTLGDTGCTKSCINEAFLRKHSNLYKRYFRPLTGSARSIDGSKVMTVGIVNMKFRLGSSYVRINCRVVRNLIHDFILGWDFFSKYDAQLYAKDGYLLCRGEKVPLIPSSSQLSGAHYATLEEVVIPPASKMHFQASLLVDTEELSNATDLVSMEPHEVFESDVRTARAIARVNKGKVLVEAINPYDHYVRVPEGTVLGYADFITDEQLEEESEDSGLVLAYGSEDSAYESAEESEPKLVAEQKPAKEPDKEKQEGKSYAFHIDYSKMATDAKPYEEQLRTLLEEKHSDVFAKHERDYGLTTLTQHHARLIDKTPFAAPPYRTTPEGQKEIDRQVNEMLADGLLSHSTSAYSAPILLVKKKEPGKFRFVTDFRKVNSATQKVVYPLPRIEDALHRLKDPKFFTSIDLVKGFWQVPIAEEDRHIYAFSTGAAHVQYNVMPMGAKNSTSTLQALMALLLRGLPVEHVVSFLDDILVASNTMEDHLQHLDKVLAALGRANLKLHPGKCAVARDSALCLGHLLDRFGIRPDPSNLKKVVNWPTPRNVKEVRGFLGLTGYYRQFIKDYAKVAEPMTDLTSKDKAWVWGEKENTAFKTLREHLTSGIIVAYPNFDLPFWIKTDASGGSLGYVLTQFHDGKEHVISYGSKKLDGTQRRWSTYDREFFGLLTGIRGNAHYLRHKPFIAVTDHRPLLAWRKQDSKKDVTGRRMRWILELESYDFELLYKQGRKHSDADALSRLENDDEDLATDDDCLESLDDDQPEGEFYLLGMVDQDVESAVKYTCLSSYLRRLRREQDDDPVISNFKRYVKARRRPPKKFESWYRRNYSRFLLKNGILYLKRFEPLTDLITLRAVVPQSLVGEILKDAHGSMLSGHPGVARMTAKLERSVVWQGMSTDVKSHVEKCQQCDLVRQQNPPVRTPLEPVVAKKVGDHVIIDLLKLPTAPGNFNYVLVCVDVFSKFVDLYKLRNKEAMGVAKCIQDLCLSRGFPKKLGSDNGGEFDNHLLDAMAKLLGMERAKSVVYRPQSQGVVERFNRQIVAELQKRLEQYEKSWVEHLPFVQYAYNSTPHTKTKVSPFKVVFGREPPLPDFEEMDVDHQKDKSVRRYVKDLQKKMAVIHEAVRENTRAKIQKEREYYDRKIKLEPYEKGDKVYEKENVRKSKLDPKWKGPAKVVKRCNSPRGDPGHTYIIERKDGSQHRRNLEQLKPVKAEFDESAVKKEPGKREVVHMYWDSEGEEVWPTPPPPTQHVTPQESPPAEALQRRDERGGEPPSEQAFLSRTESPSAGVVQATNGPEGEPPPAQEPLAAEDPQNPPLPLRDMQLTAAMLGISHDAALPPLPPGGRRENSPPEISAGTSHTIVGLSSPRAVRRHSAGTPLKGSKSRGKGKACRKGKPKNLFGREVNTDCESESDMDCSDTERLVNKSIFSFAQFLGHSGTPRKEVFKLRPPVLSVPVLDPQMPTSTQGAPIITSVVSMVTQAAPMATHTAPLEAMSVTAHNQPPNPTDNMAADDNSAPEDFVTPDEHLTPEGPMDSDPQTLDKEPNIVVRDPHSDGNAPPRKQKNSDKTTASGTESTNRRRRYNLRTSEERPKRNIYSPPIPKKRASEDSDPRGSKRKRFRKTKVRFQNLENAIANLNFTQTDEGQNEKVSEKGKRADPTPPPSEMSDTILVLATGERIRGFAFQSSSSSPGEIAHDQPDSHGDGLNPRSSTPTELEDECFEYLADHTQELSSNRL